MSSALNATAGAPGASCHATRAVLLVTSAGELTLTISMRAGTRVVTRQSRADFVPGRGIMLRISPHFFSFLYLLFTSLTHFLSCDRHVIT